MTKQARKDRKTMDYDEFDDLSPIMTAFLMIIALILLVVTFPIWVSYLVYCKWQETYRERRTA